MRLLELYLKAFGSFTERRIELPGVDGPGLCVLHGANEAGKSTALRAIRGLIYGIPARSPDDFIHRYADLRIGARLRFSDGEELAVMRRKKAKASLYDYDDSAVLESDRMDRLVEAVPELLFERFYGLDHRSLREGSAALLRDDGEVGRALFGASLGLADLGGVLTGFENEAAELFAARASTRRINAAIAEWKDTQKEIKSLALDPKDWQAQDRAVREGQERLESLTHEIEDTRTELSRLERVKRALPALAKRRLARARLEELASVRALPKDFELRLTDARASREAARDVRRRAAAKIEREAAAKDALSLAPGLVAERERIEAIHQQVDGFSNTFEQLPRRETELARLDREIEELLDGTLLGGTSLSGTSLSGASLSRTPLSRASEVGAERIASIRVAVGRAGPIRTLASEAAKFEDRVSSAQEEVAEARADLEQRRADESDFGEPECDLGSLRLSLGRAMQLGTIDDRIQAHADALAELSRDVAQMSQRLGFEAERIDNIEETSFPAHDLIDMTVQRFAELTARQESLREEGRKLRGERARIDEDLSMIRIQGAIPKPEELDERRGRRNESWRELRRTVVESNEPVDPDRGRSMADRFERESADADELADRLRIDAKRVADEGSLRARAGRLDHDLADVIQRTESLGSDEARVRAEWVALWEDTGIEARGPEVMRGWRRELDDLRGLLLQRRDVRHAAQRDESLRGEALASLRATLSSLCGAVDSGGERLDEWATEAQVVLERQTEADSARRLRGEAAGRASERVVKAVRQADQAAAALEKWARAWGEAVDTLGLAPDCRPPQALERIEQMQALLERLRERDQLADRVEKMGREVAAFEASVAILIAQCVPELKGHPPAPATLRLQRMLGESLNQQVLYEKSVEALAEAREELEEAEAKFKTSELILDELREVAGVGSEGELDEALRQWRHLEEARRSLRESEEQLENLAEGRPVTELEAQSVDANPDALAARIETLLQENQARIDDHSDAISELRSQRDQLDSMNGSGRAADLADAAQSKLAAIRRDVERYVQLRMAKQILEREIEQYRNDNQAPLLKRSGEIFGALTRGAYPRITSQVGEDGASAHLIAVAATGAEVAVEGLSAGTRDQLFMSLRLASLEESLALGETMPLIADDILIEFDDERTRATLEVLAEMGRKTQILLFSHHQHVAEIARELDVYATVIDL